MLPSGLKLVKPLYKIRGDNVSLRESKKGIVVYCIFYNGANPKKGRNITLKCGGCFSNEGDQYNSKYRHKEITEQFKLGNNIYYGITSLTIDSNNAHYNNRGRIC